MELDVERQESVFHSAEEELDVELRSSRLSVDPPLLDSCWLHERR